MFGFFAWPSVSMKQGGTYLCNLKVVKIEWEKTFDELLEKLATKYSKELGTNVAVCRNEQFTDPVHDVPHIGPVFLCQSYGMNFCFHLSRSLGYWCENVEETIVLDEEVRELQQKFQTVHPICFFCKTDGKRPFTRHPLNSAKRPKH